MQYAEEIVKSVRDDYAERKRRRENFERQWKLNTNFAAGNQYFTALPGSDYEDCEKDYFWQERETYNHIASILETRLAKLARVRPKMSVRPSSSGDEDVKAASVTEKILASCCNRLGAFQLIERGTLWSELTGSVFYKVVWDGTAGKKIPQSKGGGYEGEVKITVCPPYEIYPDRTECEDIGECESLIHAKDVPVSEVRRLWGKKVKAEEIDVASHTAGPSGKTVFGAKAESGCCIVIEKYIKATPEKPDGQLIITAGGELLYNGSLPYLNGDEGERIFPFVKQDALTRAGCFFGTSMIERAIPIQRAYNAVKNRKHEFLNRLSMGILAVEDGSVDIDNLETEGLSPGKILVYRQGSTPPAVMDYGSVPNDFTYEEDRLLQEFISVTGVSEIMRSSAVPSSVNSGVALQLLIEQDDTRLSVTAENIRTALKAIAKLIIRLYRQFASETRISRFVGGEGDVELLMWKKSDLNSDDVVFDTENELTASPAAKQAMLFDLYKMGLLFDSEGKLSDGMRYKVLEAVGYGGWEFSKDVLSLHLNKAARENVGFCEKDSAAPSEIDDHALHVSEHTKFLLSAEFRKKTAADEGLEKRALEHIRMHKKLAALSAETECATKTE